LSWYARRRSGGGSGVAIGWMERECAWREERRSGDGFQVGRAREDALGFFLPIFGVAGAADFGLDAGQSLQEELAIVGEGVLARDAAGDLVNEKFAECNVDGGGRLELPMDERMSAATVSPSEMPRIWRLR
jgi:hypothetical protein